ncbi:hypothetical protein BO83DRAFT_388803 [Aspergillus eucalypticola CBS 122712]|uniref:SNF2 N-terminal domain-containing protein n=1 Tax=Aspergillus eucalypticola (strain CBS 122712 / IBT 29274) TaxID=1448314 RepID=A0A317VKR4_ASPEC|nr:uncharacterized protein BO83DRAFT_388803 [Aspergillus eucalypticola CBS 122712]PWY73442.1 hypothetical protein BO83DRAFT_388803 [Aspergillus eucalypticola CBS 122712]
MLGMLPILRNQVIIEEEELTGWRISQARSGSHSRCSSTDKSQKVQASRELMPAIEPGLYIVEPTPLFLLSPNRFVKLIRKGHLEARAGHYVLKAIMPLICLRRDMGERMDIDDQRVCEIGGEIPRAGSGGCFHAVNNFLHAVSISSLFRRLQNNGTFRGMSIFQYRMGRQFGDLISPSFYNLKWTITFGSSQPGMAKPSLKPPYNRELLTPIAKLDSSSLRKHHSRAGKQTARQVQRLLYYRGRKQLSACSTDLAHVGGQTHHCSTIHVSFYFFGLATRLSTIQFVIVLQIRGIELSLFGHDYSTQIMLIYKATWKQRLEIYKMLVPHPSIRTSMHSSVNYFHHANPENEQIPVARTFRDECHLSFGKRSPIIRVLKRLKESWRPAYWFLSATPCPSSPCNIQAFMKLTKTPEWTGNPDTAYLNHEYLAELGRQFRTASNRDQSREPVRRARLPVTGRAPEYTPAAVQGI